MDLSFLKVLRRSTNGEKRAKSRFRDIFAEHFLPHGDKQIIPRQYVRLRLLLNDLLFAVKLSLASKCVGRHWYCRPEGPFYIGILSYGRISN